MIQLYQLMEEIAEFSDSTFGTEQRNPAIAWKLRDEVDELIEKLTIGTGDDHRANLLEEYADCLILLLDSLRKSQFRADELMAAARVKMKLNRKRKWGSPDENGIIHHIKD